MRVDYYFTVIFKKKTQSYTTHARFFKVTSFEFINKPSEDRTSLSYQISIPEFLRKIDRP